MRAPYVLVEQLRLHMIDRPSVGESGLYDDLRRSIGFPSVVTFATLARSSRLTKEVLLLLVFAYIYRTAVRAREI